MTDGGFKLKKLGNEENEPIKDNTPSEAPKIEGAPVRLKLAPKMPIQQQSDEIPSETNPSTFIDVNLPDCPNCQKKMASDTAIICMHCGHRQVRVQEEEEAPSWLQCMLLDKEATICLILGLSMTLILTSGKFEFARGVLKYLGVLIHEFGHCAWSWMMGFKSFPAFDFQHGGGITMTFGDKPNLYICGFILFCIAGTAFQFRQYKLIAGSLLALCTFIIAALTFGWHQNIILYGGHGTEAIFGSVFLFRGLANVSVHHVIERVLYFFLGTFMLLDEYLFAQDLLHDEEKRSWYLEGKPNAMNDFDRLSDIFFTNLDKPVMFHAAFCIACAITAYLVYVISTRLYTRLE